MLGLVIDGNSSPTARDVDDWIERKGSIKQAFDGVRAKEGAQTLIPYANGYFFTKKVVFKFFSDTILLVMDRHSYQCVRFSANLEQHGLNWYPTPFRPMNTAYTGGIFGNWRETSIRDLLIWKAVQTVNEIEKEQSDSVRVRAMQSDIERLRTELDRSQRAQADQRAQDWCVMSNAALLMVTLYMAAAYLM
jgi:hypothetical protein